MSSPDTGAATPDTRACLATLARSFLHLGATGFGGPVAVVPLLETGLVQRGHWLNAHDFLVAVAAGSLAALVRFDLGNALLVGIAAAIGLVGFPLLHPAWVLAR